MTESVNMDVEVIWRKKYVRYVGHFEGVWLSQEEETASPSQCELGLPR